MENQPFDEAYDIDDPEEIASNLASSPYVGKRASGGRNATPLVLILRPAAQSRPMDRGNTPPHSMSDQDNSEYDDSQDVAPKV